MCFWYKILWQFLMWWKRCSYFRAYLALFICCGTSHVSFTLFFKWFCVPRSDFLLRNATAILKLMAALLWEQGGYFTKAFLTRGRLCRWVLHTPFMKHLQWLLTANVLWKFRSGKWQLSCISECWRSSNKAQSHS